MTTTTTTTTTTITTETTTTRASQLRSKTQKQEQERRTPVGVDPKAGVHLEKLEFNRTDSHTAGVDTKPPGLTPNRWHLDLSQFTPLSSADTILSNAGGPFFYAAARLQGCIKSTLVSQQHHNFLRNSGRPCHPVLAVWGGRPFFFWHPYIFGNWPFVQKPKIMRKRAL